MKRQRAPQTKSAQRLALAALLLSFSLHSSQAGSANWFSFPPTSNWNSAANWSAGGPPNGAAETATFATSSRTGVSLPANVEVNRIHFGSGASAFLLTTEASFTLTISGVGITNISGVTQSFHATAATNSAALAFTNGATAGSQTAFTNGGSPNAGLEGAITSFANNSTAGSSVFTNNPGTTANAGGGALQFYATSTAGNSTISNKGSAIPFAFGGRTDFFGASTAGNSTITNNGPGANDAGNGRTQFFQTSSAGDGTVINDGSPYFASGGLTEFYDNSTAGNATFTNNPGTNNGILHYVDEGGRVEFSDSSTANTATFINYGGAQNRAISGKVVFRANSTAADGMFINNGATDPDAFFGGRTFFADESTAANATLIANAGISQDLGGSIVFTNFSSGGTARLKIFGNGWLEMYNHGAPGVTVGSIEGDGRVLLGGYQLTIGNNNTSTIFSGTIENGSPFAGAMGSIKKIGLGTFTLANANSYSGGTFVNAGTLGASHDGALGAGNVNVAVNADPDTTLILQSGATNDYISDVARLHIVTDSTVNLNYTGNPDVIGFLFLNDVIQPAGLYGSAASGAPNQLPQFTGAGKILVTTPTARSRKQHGSADAHITLPFTGPVGIECRNPGANNSYTVILTFGFPVTFANAAVTSGTGMVVSTTGNGTDSITLELAGVTNAQRLAVTLSGVNYGTNTGDVVIRMGVLLGDTTANGTVNASDIGQTRAASGQPVDASNFRTDVTVSGSINASDIALVKSMAGTALP